jgi:hypothetical protein
MHFRLRQSSNYFDCFWEKVSEIGIVSRDK